MLLLLLLLLLWVWVWVWWLWMRWLSDVAVVIVGVMVVGCWKGLA